MNNYIASVCMQYGTYIYYDLLNGNVVFHRINNCVTTI